MKLSKPTNQWSLVVYLLIEKYTQGITMKDAMQVYFHKFQSRLGEVEKSRKDKLKIRRLPITKKNRFGHTCTFLNYKSVANKKYLLNLYEKLNREGNPLKKQAA